MTRTVFLDDARVSVSTQCKLFTSIMSFLSSWLEWLKVRSARGFQAALLLHESDGKLTHGMFPSIVTVLDERDRDHRLRSVLCDSIALEAATLRLRHEQDSRTVSLLRSRAPFKTD